MHQRNGMMLHWDTRWFWPLFLWFSFTPLWSCESQQSPKILISFLSDVLVWWPIFPGRSLLSEPWIEFGYFFLFVVTLEWHTYVHVLKLFCLLILGGGILGHSLWCLGVSPVSVLRIVPSSDVQIGISYMQGNQLITVLFPSPPRIFKALVSTFNF